QQQEALINYRQAILNALEEVENAIAAYTRERNRREELAEEVSASQRSAVLARDRYLSGLTDYLSVLDAQRTVLQGEGDLGRSDTALAEELVALHKALGGG